MACNDNAENFSILTIKCNVMIKKKWKMIFEREFKGGISKKASLLLSLIFIFTLTSTVLNGCGDKDDPVKKEETGLNITKISIPASIDVVSGGVITINGNGFDANDNILLTLSSVGKEEFLIDVTSVTDKSVTFSIPANIPSGKYNISVIRGDKSLMLGSLILNIVANTSIPDVAGMTLKGVVFSDGKGLAGVVVSDGYEVTTTDANGIYYLPSLKKNGYVFISVPGNYEVANTNNLPQFFKRVGSGNTVEQKDFSLIKTDNNKHIVLAMADWHLAGRNDDVSQFNTVLLSDINATIADYAAKGMKVYGLTLGDLSWDGYWYENNFALPEYLIQMYKINCPIFNVIGNHDNNPYSQGDWLSALDYKNIVGPNYYSFNLGNIHYIVLDDVEYINSGGAQGVIGARNYNGVVVPDQIEWLKKDLATITDKNTPIVIGMHIPLYKQPVLNTDGTLQNSLRLNNGNELIYILKEFSNVHVLSGHSHVNYAVEASSTLMEHNTGAVCATWWWTGKNGYAGNHICTDGSPGGYGVWEMSGNDIQWHYKSAGYEKEYQFRSYDLNTVHITAEKFAPNSTNVTLSQYSGIYGSPSSSNEVLINVWGYDSKWKVEVKENGNSLDVNRVTMDDPLHIISYSAKRLNVGATPGFVTTSTNHFFKAKASSSTSTLEINVTDRFGRVYTESMRRPKEFTYLMK